MSHAIVTLCSLWALLQNLYESGASSPCACANARFFLSLVNARSILHPHRHTLASVHGPAHTLLLRQTQHRATMASRTRGQVLAEEGRSCDSRWTSPELDPELEVPLPTIITALPPRYPFLALF